MAYDAADNWETTPASYTWTVDATAPSAPLITSPANNSSDTDGDFTVTGTAEPGGTVELFEGSISKGTAQVDSSGQWSIPLSGVAEGSHTYTAGAKDAVGNSSARSNPLSVIVDATAPAAPVISSPPEASLNSGSFVVSGTAELGSTIEVFEGTTSKGTTRTDAQGNWSKALSGVADGSHTYTAKATDAAGHVSTVSNARTVNVDTQAPSAPVITSPANNSFDIDGNITLSGTAETGSTVRVFDGTTSKGTTPVDSNGAWSKTLSAVSQGTHTYTAKATDAANNTSGPSNSLTVKVDTTRPTVKSTTPLSGATGVGLSTNLTATFSEKMRVSSVNATTFKLYRVNADGTQTQITDVVVSLSSDGLTATLNPFGAKTTLLARNTKYKGVITTGTKDLAGNALAQQKSWTFRTRS